jgi:iron complex outermembrane recepter protein
MSRSSHKRIAAAALGAIAVGIVNQSFAQQGLEEILVTAERRETSLQQTPISIVAFSAETMEIKGIETLEDVANFTPNLDIKGSRGSGDVSPTYEVRGLSGGGGATGERAVGMYLDGIYMPRTTGPFMDVLDVDRIEILRGPQGTLFGRNSTGGAIRIFTKQPGPDTEGYVKLGAGNFGRADITGMFNVPLSDTVFLRGQAASQQEDGYVRRGSQELGSSDDTMARLQLAFEPNDNLRLSFGLSSWDSKSSGNPQDLATFDMRPNLNFEGGQADWVSDWLEASGQPRIDPADDPRIVLDSYTLNDWCFIDDTDPDWDPLCEQFNNSSLDQFDARVDWQIKDNLTLTSITGISSFKSTGVTDWVMLGQELRPTNVDSDVTYQELQIDASMGDGKLELVAGLSYFQEDSMSDGVRLERTGTSAFPASPNGNTALVGTGPGGTRRLDDTTTSQNAESYGLFANLTYNITDKLAITPGVRFSDDTKSAVLTRRNTDEWTAAVGTSTTMYAGTSESETDYRLTIDYQISDNHMVYLTSSKSFRAGAGVTLPMGGIPSDPTALQAEWDVAPPFTLPESVKNNEIGMRTEWADQRVRVNLTYYDMLYGDRQAPAAVLDPTSPTGFFISILDSGDVDLNGIELDGQVSLTDNMMFDFSAGTVDYNVHDVCLNNGKFIFPGPVEKSYTLGVNWAKDINEGRRMSWALNYAWVGPQETHPGSAGVDACTPGSVSFWFTDSRYRLPDYGLLNGRVSMASGDGKWLVSLFGNNLTDEVYANFASRFGGGFWEGSPAPFGLRAPDRSALGNTMGRPREFGVTFQYNFGEAARR